MRFTAIFFLTASLVNVAFSYTAKELDALQQYFEVFKSGIDTIAADLSRLPLLRGGILGNGLTLLGSDGAAFNAIVAQGVKLIDNIQVDDEESQELVIDTLVPYCYTDARNAVNGFIDGKSTFDQLGVTALVKPILTQFISDLNAIPGALVAHSSPTLSTNATALVEIYKELEENALAAYS